MKNNDTRSWELTGFLDVVIRSEGNFTGKSVIIYRMQLRPENQMLGRESMMSISDGISWINADKI